MTEEREKIFNKWFNAFILIGMIISVTIITIFKLQAPGARTFMLIVAAIGSIMGVVNTVLSANGNIWTFLFGLIDVVLCSIVYYDSGVMGTFALHVLYFLPMQFVGYWQWRKRGAKAVSDESGEASKVRARRLTPKQWMLVAVALVCGIAVAYAILYYIDAARLDPSEIDRAKILLDATVVMLNIMGQILMSLAFTEQWYIWLAVNVFSIMLWTNRLLAAPRDSYSIVMVIKYVFYLLNSLNGIRIWHNLSKEEPKQA